MIKSIKPGLLAGKPDAVIEKMLEELFSCPVEYSDFEARIYCVEEYESPRKLMSHMARLSKVGTCCVASQHGDAFVLLRFNEEARRVISGQRANQTSFITT